MEKKLTRVQFFYDDGSSKFIDGNMLDRWSGMNHQVALFCQIHQSNPDWTQVKWTEVPAIPIEQPDQGSTDENVVSAIG